MLPSMHAASSLSWSRPQIRVMAPASANLWAAAKPMPDEPPVTSTTLPPTVPRSDSVGPYHSVAAALAYSVFGGANASTRTSNPDAFDNAMARFLEGSGTERRPARTKALERRFVTYLQRFCAKNDTASFFGPMNYGALDRDLRKAVNGT